MRWSETHPLVTKKAKCDVFFVFGTEKRATFHTQDYLDKLANTEGSGYASLECGHWIQHQKPKELCVLIKNFIN